MTQSSLKRWGLSLLAFALMTVGLTHVFHQHDTIATTISILQWAPDIDALAIVPHEAYRPVEARYLRQPNLMESLRFTQAPARRLDYAVLYGSGADAWLSRDTGDPSGSA